MEGYENSSSSSPESMVTGADQVIPLSEEMAAAIGVRGPQFPATGLYISTRVPSSSCVRSIPLLLLGRLVLYTGDHVLPKSSESLLQITPAELLNNICTLPGDDSHRVGWMTPSSGIRLRSIGMNSVADHVLPPSSLLSVNAFHTPSFSFEAGASQLPSDSTMGLFRTGPRPPLSPGTSSRARVHVLPWSSETIYHVSHSSITLPTLK